MTAKKMLEFFSRGQKGTYENLPGEDVPKGRSGEALVRDQQVENAIEDSDEQPVSFALGGSRCSGGQYYPGQRLLIVQWRNQKTKETRYFDVSQDEADGLASSASPGSYVRLLESHAFHTVV